MCTQTTISGQRFLFSLFHTLSFVCLLGDFSFFFLYVCWDISVSLTGFCLSAGSFMYFLFLLGNRSFIYCCGCCIMISNRTSYTPFCLNQNAQKQKLIYKAVRNNTKQNKKKQSESFS